MNLKSSLAAEAGAGAEVDVGAEVVVVVVEHVQEVGSRPRQEPLARPLPARLLGRQVVLQPALGRQVVLQPVPGPQEALPARKLRRAELAPAAVCQGKVPALASVQPERVQTSPAAVQRLDK